MKDEDFTLVLLPLNGKNRRKVLRNSNLHLKKKNKLNVFETLTEYVDINLNLSLIEQKLLNIKLRFPQKYIDNILSSIQTLLCNHSLALIKIIGLGSFEDSLSSSYQLVLINEIRDYFKVRKVLFQDPITNNLEKMYLKRHKIEFIEGTNLFVSDEVDGFLFYYMIHCEHFMYDQILASNFVNGQFKNLIIIGNDFKNYRDGFDEYLYIKKFASKCRIIELNISVDSFAFNDTCINYISNYNDFS